MSLNGNMPERKEAEKKTVKTASKGSVISAVKGTKPNTVVVTLQLAQDADGKQASFPSSNYEKTGCMIACNFSEKIQVEGTECRLLGNIMYK